MRASKSSQAYIQKGAKKLDLKRIEGVFYLMARSSTRTTSTRWSSATWRMRSLRRSASWKRSMHEHQSFQNHRNKDKEKTRAGITVVDTKYGGTAACGLPGKNNGN